MKETFFTTLREIKESLSNSKSENYINITDNTRKGFKEFTTFISECLLFPGKRFYAIQYICKYWYLTTVELHNRYCRETGKQVSYSAIQQSMTRASLAYSRFFGRFNLYEVFDGKHDKEIDDLLFLCDMVLEDAESGLVPIFIAEVYNYNTNKKCGEYELEDCMNEIEMLRSKLKSSIYAELDTIDADKLLYLVNVIKQPLFNTKQNDVNHIKFNLLNYLKGRSYQKELALKKEKQEGINNSETDINENQADNLIENYAERDDSDETLNFDMDEELGDFDEEINENLEEEENNNNIEYIDVDSEESIDTTLNRTIEYIKDYDYDDDVFEETVNEKKVLQAVKFLTLYTKEGLDKYLSSFNRAEMKRAFEIAEEKELI